MTDKECLKLIKKIDKLINKKNSITTYNLSSSAPFDGYPDLYDACVKKNAKAEKKRKKYNDLIVEILLLIKSSGRSIDKIIENYKDIEIEHLLSYREQYDTEIKRKNR